MNILLTYRSGANKLRLRDKNVYPCDAVQYIRITCLSVYRSVAVEADSRVTILSPAGKKVQKVHFSNHGYGHTSVIPLYCSNGSLYIAYPECTINRQSFSSSSLRIFM